jgi:uncharacterized membrane protein YeaQ/YmgE (transglycosylase-associated protein family)
MFLNLLGWALVGLMVGWMVSRLMRGHSYTLLGSLVVGLVGALFGGLVAHTIFGLTPEQVDLSSLLTSLASALLCVGLLHRFVLRHMAF